MIVYVESNFVLEMVLRQRDAGPAEQILELAEKGKIELAFPSFALCEPFWTIYRRERDQERLSKLLEGMIDQLPTFLANAAKKEKDSLWATVSRLVDVGTSIETDGTCLRRALEYQKRFDFSQQDSIIYSAVIADIQHRPFTETKCFISTNYKDFKDPTIIAELNSYNCRYEQSFGKALNFIT
jgi:hypothetical protein